MDWVNKQSELSQVENGTTFRLIPTRLAATPGNKKVTLYWHATSTPPQEYRIYYRTSPSDPYSEPLITTNTYYEHLNLENNITYYYVVAAFSDGQERFSDEVSVTPNDLPEFIRIESIEPTTIDPYKVGEPYTSIKYYKADHCDKVWVEIMDPITNQIVFSSEHPEPKSTSLVSGVTIEPPPILWHGQYSANAGSGNVPDGSYRVILRAKSGEKDYAVLTPSVVSLTDLYI